MKNRIAHLDSIRALAILLVLLYHYCTRWTAPRSEFNLYPYGDQLTGWALIDNGHFGVELFFIVSGFVISLTLRHCASPFDFAAKRAARLLPAMIVCSTLTYILLTFVVHVPQLTPKLVDFAPSWTFTSPFFWRWLDPNIAYIDQAYWTLFVEARFYFWACLIYFTFRNRFEEAFLVFAAAAVTLHLASLAIGNTHLYGIISLVFLPKFLPWFVAGILFFRIYDHRGSRIDFAVLAGLMIYLAAYHVLSAPLSQATWAVLGFIVFNFSIFTVFIAKPSLLDIPGARVLQAIGLASYALYLLHQKIGVAMIAQIDPDLPLTVQLAIVAAIIAALIIVSIGIFRFVENPGKRWMLSHILGKKPHSAELPKTFQTSER